MKKIGVLLASLITAVVMLASCAAPEVTEQRVNFIVPNGSPAISIAKLVSEFDEIDGVKMDYEIVTGASTLGPSLISDSAQIAIMPTNVAATLYNKGADIKLVSVNVHGNMYLLSTHENLTLEDLKGKVVYSIGQTGTPDIMFKYLLDDAGISYNNPDDEDSVTIEFGAQDTFPANVISGTYEYAIVSEPIVTNVIAKANSIGRELKISLDFQEAWGEITGMTGIPQASIVVRGDIFIKFPGLVESILEILADNEVWVAENAEKANAALKERSGSDLPPLSGAILERSNISLKLAKDAKADIITYFEAIMEFDSNQIGGKLPDNSFYYIP